MVFFNPPTLDKGDTSNADAQRNTFFYGLG